MAWRRKKSNESLPSSSKTGPEEDAKTANLQAAFAKIKYPTPVVSMVGAVVHADGKVEGRHPISAPASPQNALPIPQTPVPAATTVAKTPAPEKTSNETARSRNFFAIRSLASEGRLEQRIKALAVQQV